MREIQGHPFRFPINASPEVGLQKVSNSVRRWPGRPAIDFGKCLGFLRLLLILVHQRTSWSPFVILGEFWRLLINISKHREILSTRSSSGHSLKSFKTTPDLPSNISFPIILHEASQEPNALPAFYITTGACMPRFPNVFCAGFCKETLYSMKSYAAAIALP